MKNLPSHARLAILALLILFSSSVSGQPWSSPQQLTFSESNKAAINMQFTWNEDWMVLWEQSTDSTSTAICYQEQIFNGEPEILLSEPMTHFKNPKSFFTGSSSDTLFYVFYQKVTPEKTEIYYVKLAGDGGHSNPVPFAIQGNHNLYYSFNDEFITWVSDDYLLSSLIQYEAGSFYFAPPDTISSGNISDVVINHNYIFWIDDDGLESKLMKSYVEEGFWAEPEELIAETTGMKSLETVNSSPSSAWQPFRLIAWTFEMDGLWYVNNLTEWEWWLPNFDTLSISSEEPFDFSVFCEDVITDDPGSNNSFYGPYCVAFSQAEAEHREIFVTENNYGVERPVRISWLETESIHPVIVQGEPVYNYGYKVYIVWQALVEGYWQFFCSDATFVWGSIDDEQSLSKQIEIFPNPARDFIQIKNETELDISIKVFDMTGKRVYHGSFNGIVNEIKITGWERGVYFVNISQKNRMITRKLVLL